jgi:nicotinamide riboside kinase
MMGRVISISGAPGSGKSTLFAQLEDVLGAAATFMPDLPLTSFQALDPTLEAWADPDFQHYVGFSQLMREAGAGNGETLVFDKSLLDAVAYWDVLFGASKPRWTASLGEGRYELVLLCDYHGIEPRPEPIHRVHLSLRERLAKRTAELAELSARRVVRLSGARDERLDLALTELGAVGLGTRAESAEDDAQ